MLLEIDEGSSSLSAPTTGLQHVFSDGTCSWAAPYKFGAWGCINATSSQLISLGHVSGLTRTSDRAEIFGAIVALRWQIHFQVGMMLWLDSEFVANGLEYLLLHRVAGESWTNRDLWNVVLQLLHQSGELSSHHIWMTFAGLPI